MCSCLRRKCLTAIVGPSASRRHARALRCLRFTAAIFLIITRLTSLKEGRLRFPNFVKNATEFAPVGIQFFHSAVENSEPKEQIPLVNLKIVIEPGDDGYFVAHCPSLKSCWSQGKTREEALKNVREAIDLYLDPLERRIAGRRG